MFTKKEAGVFNPENLKSITNNSTIKNLSQSELESLISIIQKIISAAYYNKIDLKSCYEPPYKSNSKLDIYTMYKFHQKKSKNILKCPRCDHTELSKNGVTNNRQRYICKNCRTTFDERSFSPLSNTKLSLYTWLKYCRFMVEGGTIKYCAQKVSVSVPTSFFMRHRILDVLNLSLRNQVFEGIVSTDEFNLNESFKGKSYKKSIDEDRCFHNFKYDDLSRCVGWTFRNPHYLLKNPEKYINPIQVKINTAMDKNGHLLTRIIENPHFNRYNKCFYQDVLSFFENRLDKNATLCAFNSGLYRDVATKLNVKFKKVRNRMSQPVYSVRNVFMYHQKLSHWLANFHGVATKYLNNYLAWHTFLYMIQNLNKIERLYNIFMQFVTKKLSITKEQIQNRKVEFIQNTSIIYN